MIDGSLPERIVPDWFLRGLEVLDRSLDDRPLLETDAVLWTVVLLSGVFDVLTTMVGLEIGLQEGNAVARAFIATYGLSGIGWLKLAAVLLLAVVWVLLPKRSATITLAGFAVVSLLVVALNAISLLGV
ncbi:MAG: DUF5658 family protein [Halodesulfurarchaeum sp.]